MMRYTSLSNLTSNLTPYFSPQTIAAQAVLPKRLFRTEEQDQAVKEIELTYFLPDICNMCTFQSCK